MCTFVFRFCDHSSFCFPFSVSIEVAMYRYPSVNEMREIEEEYPNFYNRDLPAFAYCTGGNSEDNREHLKQAFTRSCSKYFCVKSVTVFKGINKSNCQVRVTYGMKNDEDLPLEPDLKHLVSLLLKHAPFNASIMAEQRTLELPKNVVIVYEIYCRCPLKSFDQAAYPSQMQPLIKQFQDLQA